VSERVVEVKNLVAGYLPGVNILNGVNFYADKGELINLWPGKSSRGFNHS
jgi:branched-chain amino acid transport system ATP-binding protein